MVYKSYLNKASIKSNFLIQLFLINEVLQQLSHPGLQHSYCLKDSSETKVILTSDPQATTALLLSTDLHFLDISYDRDHTRYCAWLLSLSTMLWRFIHVTDTPAVCSFIAEECSILSVHSWLNPHLDYSSELLYKSLCEHVFLYHG